MIKLSGKFSKRERDIARGKKGWREDREAFPSLLGQLAVRRHVYISQCLEDCKKKRKAGKNDML
jgi:hypothetical protein